LIKQRKNDLKLGREIAFFKRGRKSFQVNYTFFSSSVINFSITFFLLEHTEVQAAIV
jgi:hypothetical protein